MQIIEAILKIIVTQAWRIENDLLKIQDSIKHFDNVEVALNWRTFSTCAVAFGDPSPKRAHFYSPEQRSGCDYLHGISPERAREP